jgi:CelD/BcsL family acetyltransferase involved in cellulose biosynthesis
MSRELFSQPQANKIDQTWTVEIIASLNALLALKEEWLMLQNRAEKASIFSTFEYISIAWKYFKEEKDNLLVLAIRQQGQLVCIAPFEVEMQIWKGIPTRVVQWIARWEGNCPDLLTEKPTLLCWERIHYFFQREFSGWDMLQLSEIVDDIDSALSATKGVNSEVQMDSIGFYIELQGSYEDYFAKLDTKVKANWRTRSRKIMALSPVPIVQKIKDALEMERAVERFVEIEQRSWKADANIGIGKDQKHQNFYKELAANFATQGTVTFYFLKSGDTDIAASLLFMFHNVVYERHIAHNPDFSNLSTGVYLRTVILQDYFEQGWREFDLMGMHPSIGGQRHKADWATGQRVGCTYRIYRRFGRMFPVPLKNYLIKQLGKGEHIQESRAAAMTIKDTNKKGR